MTTIPHPRVAGTKVFPLVGMDTGNAWTWEIFCCDGMNVCVLNANVITLKESSLPLPPSEDTKKVPFMRKRFLSDANSTSALILDFPDPTTLRKLISGT
jgi:hypothetical protein